MRIINLERSDLSPSFSTQLRRSNSPRGFEYPRLRQASFEDSCILDASRQTLAGEVLYHTADDELTSPVAARVLGNEIPDSQDEGSESAGAESPVMGVEPLNPQDGIESHDDDDDYDFDQRESDEREHEQEGLSEEADSDWEDLFEGYECIGNSDHGDDDDDDDDDDEGFVEPAYPESPRDTCVVWRQGFLYTLP
jgi:hypothetical protein